MSTCRVLLADRDEDLLILYREFLLQKGFDVLTAQDGIDCVDKLRTFRPEVLVLDPELPWGGAEGVLAMIYEDPEVPFVPVMVLADEPDPEGRCSLGSFPVSSYRVKPVMPADLAMSVRRLLQKRLLARHS
jgi:DNA-binding response OmpR family regulator